MPTRWNGCWRACRAILRLIASELQGFARAGGNNRHGTVTLARILAFILGRDRRIFHG